MTLGDLRTRGLSPRRELELELDETTLPVECHRLLRTWYLLSVLPMHPRLVVSDYRVRSMQLSQHIHVQGKPSSRRRENEAVSCIPTNCSYDSIPTDPQSHTEAQAQPARIRLAVTPNLHRGHPTHPRAWSQHPTPLPSSAASSPPSTRPNTTLTQTTQSTGCLSATPSLPPNYRLQPRTTALNLQTRTSETQTHRK